MKEEKNQSNLLVSFTMYKLSLYFQKSITRYTVRIAEDDGEIDTDLPGMHTYECHVLSYMYCGIELRAEEKIGKFGFTSLGIVEVILE